MLKGNFKFDLNQHWFGWFFHVESITKQKNWWYITNESNVFTWNLSNIIWNSLGLHVSTINVIIIQDLEIRSNILGNVLGVLLWMLFAQAELTWVLILLVLWCGGLAGVHHRWDAGLSKRSIGQCCQDSFCFLRYWHTPEALCGMMTHKPTTDDSKYFAHAPTLPSSPRRALHHVNSRTTGIKSLDVEPDRKKKENLIARSPGPHVQPKKVSEFYKSLLTCVTS